MPDTNNDKKIQSYRWVILTLFIMIALISQLLWLTFASISSEISDIYHVSAFDVSLLSLVWPLIFVIFAIPVGIFIDKNGFNTSVRIGAIFLALFAVMRVFSTSFGNNFPLLLISQTGAAISQPFIFGSITKLAISWFPEKEHGLATGLGTIGLFLGMMLALAVTPVLFQEYGLKSMLIIYAFVSCIAAFLFALLGREEETTISEQSHSSFTLRDIWKLSKSKRFAILEYGFFAVVGGFTAIMTWLEEILNALHGLDIDQAGLVGGIMILGGIIGSIIMPTLSDKMKILKPIILLNLAVGTSILFFIEVFNGILFLSIAFFVAGFFLMSALPLVLEISSKISSIGMEGRASSLLWFFSQIGSVILIAIVEPIKSITGSYYYSIFILSILWAVAFFLFIGINEEVDPTV